MLNTLVIFGASGDLAGRLLLPAVASLQTSGAFGPDLTVVGADRQARTDDEFAAQVARRMAEHAPDLDRAALVSAMRYHRADVAEPADVARVIESARSGSAPLAVYLALPTQLMLGAIQALSAADLPPGSRVAVEKPFGHDARSAAELNAAVSDLERSGERLDVYRVDHALAMTVVQNLPSARLPGTDRPIVWNGATIEQVELLWEETLALEGRASFYDRAGALRDVLQNHLVQLMCTIAQPPGPAGGGDASDRRATVLRAVRTLSADDVRTRTRRARYTSGRLAERDGADGRMVPDYTAEDGVDPGRDTETFAEVSLELESVQWAGTRFVLRAGKALSARRRGVLIRFRPGVSPETTAWLDVDDTTGSQPVEAEPAAYRRVVADLMEGRSTFAVGGDEAELAWHVLMPVLDGWRQGSAPLAAYRAGSAGPGIA